MRLFVFTELGKKKENFWCEYKSLQQRAAPLSPVATVVKKLTMEQRK